MKTWSNRPRLEIGLVFGAGTAIALLLGLTEPFGISDFGFQYLLSRAWARGEDLYRGYQVIYPTGQYAWYGAVLRVLGEPVWVFRLARALLMGTSAGLLFAVLRSRGGRLLAWSAALALAASGIPSATTLSMVLVFAAALSVAGERVPSHRVVLVAAVLSGVLVGWREDGAVLAGLVVVAAVWRRRRPSELLTLALPGAVLGFLPWILVAMARGEVASFAQHLVHRFAFLLQRLPQPERPPWCPVFPPLSPRQAAELVLPALVAAPVAVYLLMLFSAWRSRRRGLDMPGVMVAAALVGFAYLPQFIWECPNFHHFRAHLPVLIGAVAVGAGVFGGPLRRMATIGLACLAAVAAGGLFLQHALAGGVVYPTVEARRIGAALEGGAPPWAGLDRRPGETLIVLGWGPGWYVVEDIPRGTRVLLPSPRHLSTEEARRGLAAELKRTSNRWVITGFATSQVPQEILDVLAARYREGGSWQEWLVWERKAAYDDGLPGTAIGGVAEGNGESR